MKSSLGSDAFAMLALGGICVFVVLLLRYFVPLRSSPAYLTVPVFLALALPLSIFLLVPIDLASSSRVPDEKSRGIWLPDSLILVAWRVMYWLTFALTWFILPLLGEYADSGYRAPKDRLIYSVRSNDRYQLIMLMCAGGGAIYVFLANGFKGGSVKSLVMALAYCWGLIMAIYLMGHGLVAIPRRLFRNAKPAPRLFRIECRAPRMRERLSDAELELEELEQQLTQLRRRKNAVSRDHEEWIEEISDASTTPTSSTMPTSTRGLNLPAVITDRYLAEFSRKLARARHQKVRYIDAWDRLVLEYAELKALVQAIASKQLTFSERSSRSSKFASAATFNFLTPYTRYFLYLRIIPLLRLAVGAIFSAASVCIIWSEMVSSFAPKLSVIGVSMVSYRDKKAQITFGGQVNASVWLLYMSLAALASFDDVKIWGNRALVRRNTYSESATWYSAQIAKLTVPLAYNFITQLPAGVYEKTQFFQFLGALINLTPLGKYFDLFFPIFILVPVCATLFDLYGRAKRLLGLTILLEEAPGDNSASSASEAREGRQLLEIALDGANIGLSQPTDGASALQRSATSRSNNGLEVPGPSETLGLGRPPTYAQRQAQRLAEATAAAEEEDESFFQGFAHRVQNTIDSLERPEWVNDLGKKPKWMERLGRNESQPDSENVRTGFGQWFGGRSDGQLRI